MPTNTYTELKKETVAVAASSITIDLTGISGYTDLELVATVQASVADQALTIQFNGDNGTGSLYSNTALRLNGTAAQSFKQSGATLMLMSNSALPPTSGFALYNSKFFDYTNTSTSKTVLTRSSSAASGVDLIAGLWRNTNAITSIKIAITSGNLAVGSTFSVYGIKAVSGDAGLKALGGTITEDSTHYYHTYKGSGSFTPLQSLSADILVVAGGGGGATAGGGAGAGGLLGFASQSLTAQKYPVIVGAGGTGAQTTPVLPTNGNDSKFGSLTTALGGGRASGYNGGATYFSSVVGGSGGGGAFNAQGQFANGTAGQGNAGNNGYQADGGGDPRSGGGGGGAGGAATNGGVANTGANGGVGATNGSTVGGSAGPYSFINAMGAASGTGQLSGGNYYYAGGGGGHGKTTGGSGGVGGGGNGSGGSALSVAGTQYTGGGAGSGGPAYDGPQGGSGIVIIRYTKA